MSREDELRRGAEIAARWAAKEQELKPDEAVEARREIIRRWEEGRKVQIFEHYRKSDLCFDKAAVVNDVEVAIERFGPSWPSEQYIAQVALAIGALSSFEGVPETSSEKRKREQEAARQLQERERRDEYRKHQGQWKAIYEPGKD